jgi:ribonuclease HII
LAKRPASRKSARKRAATSRAVRAPARRRRRAPADGCDAEAALRERFRALVDFDRAFLAQGLRVIAGVDEAGRGALAGPVVSAAVVLREDCALFRVNDSKTVPEDDREALFQQIIAAAVSVGISFGHPSLIDRDNILQATLVTMHRAVAALRLSPDLVLVDGREKFQWPGRLVPVVKGDAKSLSVAAASIVAKVARDRLMRRLHRMYPLYHFDRNKGYGTRDHLQAIAAHGAAVVHRRSFLGKVVENNLSMF